MADDWEARIERFWREVDVEDADDAVAAMRALVDERPSVHDSVGREAAAVALYREALDAGLSGARRSRAVVQLASSLRNVGDPAAAVALLEALPDDPVIGAAREAFLALALRDLDRHDDALRIALQALAPTLPRYGRAVDAYAQEL